MDSINDVEQLIERLKKLAKDEKRVHFIGMMNPRRPGVMGFATYLEYIYFPPFNFKPQQSMTEAKTNFNKLGLWLNEDYDFTLVEWELMTFVIISVPVETMPHAKEIADIFKLRFEEGVIPFSITSKGIRSFPMSLKNFYSLSNVHNHPVYTNNQEIIKEILTEEDKAIDELFKSFETGSLHPYIHCK